MLHFIYHMTLNLLEISFLTLKWLFFHYVRNVVMDVLAFPENLWIASGLLILMHGVISLPDWTSYDIKRFSGLFTIDLFYMYSMDQIWDILFTLKQVKVY